MDRLKFELKCIKIALKYWWKMRQPWVNAKGKKMWALSPLQGRGKK